MKYLGIFAVLMLLLVPVMAADVTIVLGSVEIDGSVVEEEYFTLNIEYTIFNSDDTEKSVDELELELELPNTVTGTTHLDLPNVIIPAYESVTQQIVVQNLKAIDHGSHQTIKVLLRDRDVSATTNYVFDIAQATTFSMNLYPEDPAVGQWVRVSGDIWPVTTVFVGKDADGNDIIVQNRTIGGEYAAKLVLIVTPWGTYKTMSDFRGTYSTMIPALQPGEHLIIASVEGEKTSTRTLNVKGFNVELEAIPDKVKVGEVVTILGKVDVPGLSKVPVKLSIDGEKKSLLTDIHGIFQTAISPQGAGQVKVTAVVTWNGKYSTDEITIEVEEDKQPSEEDVQLKILPLMPTSVLAGTTINIRGTIMREDLTPALISIDLPDRTEVYNSTDGDWSVNVVAPQEPGFYPITIQATDTNGTNYKQVMLRVVPFSQAIIDIHPDKPQYAPGDNAIIDYTVDLTQDINTQANIRVKWYGKVIYEESKAFSEKLNGTINLVVDPGDYEVEIESLGNIKKTRFQVFTPLGSETQTGGEEKITLSNKLTIPAILGAILAAVVFLA